MVVTSSNNVFHKQLNQFWPQGERCVPRSLERGGRCANRHGVGLADRGAIANGPEVLKSLDLVCCEHLLKEDCVLLQQRDFLCILVLLIGHSNYCRQQKAKHFGRRPHIVVLGDGGGGGYVQYTRHCYQQNNRGLSQHHTPRQNHQCLQGADH